MRIVTLTALLLTSSTASAADPNPPQRPVLCYEDADGDGFAGETIIRPDDFDCDDPGEADHPLDCDDTNARISPDAEEIVGNAIDEDCDGFIVCYADLDNDGYGDPDGLVVSTNDDCDGPDESSVAGDCDDTSAESSPDQSEVPGNGFDEDCDGLIALDDTSDPYWAGGRPRCAASNETPAFGLLLAALLFTLSRRGRADSEVA